MRDRIYGKFDQKPYSIDNTLLREARSTLWKCRLTKTIPNIADLKNRLKRQIPTLLLVNKSEEITLGLKNLKIMAENEKKIEINKKFKKYLTKHIEKEYFFLSTHAQLSTKN